MKLSIINGFINNMIIITSLVRHGRCYHNRVFVPKGYFALILNAEYRHK